MEAKRHPLGNYVGIVAVATATVPSVRVGWVQLVFHDRVDVFVGTWRAQECDFFPDWVVRSREVFARAKFCENAL